MPGLIKFEVTTNRILTDIIFDGFTILRSLILTGPLVQNIKQNNELVLEKYLIKRFNWWTKW